MKRTIKQYIYGICLLAIFTACNDFLSELPDNRTLIDSEEKIKGLLVNAYPTANYHLMASIMSDNADDKEINAKQLEENLYKWKTPLLTNRDTPEYYWDDAYSTIAHANQALASIEELKATKGWTENLKAAKGEGLLCRAYAHFMLVNFWGKHYDPATATKDLGVPYVLQPETELLKQYRRKTVKEVYDLIEKDLLEGLQIISNDYKQPRFHFTREAANAFASRFYLYKGDWDKVIFHSNKSFNGSNPALEIRDVDAYDALTYNQQARRYISSVDEPSNLLLVSTWSLWERRFASTRFGLSAQKLQELRAIHNPFGRWAYNIFGRSTSYNIPKYDEYFRYTNRSAGAGYPFVTIVLLDKDEALLNRAESFVMKKQYDKALEDLTQYLSKKTRNYRSGSKLTETMITNNFSVENDELTPYYNLDDKQKKFIKAILEFKRWEYYHEGMRWFDIRRFHMKVTHKFKNSPDLILSKNDPRKELQIPISATSRGIKPNPR